MLCVLTLVSVTEVLWSRDSLVIVERRLGIAAPWNVNIELGNAWHTTSFTTLSGVQTCCTGFQNPSGTNILLAGSYRIASVLDKIDISALAGISSVSASFRTTQNELIDYNGDAYSADVEHALDMRFWSLPIGLRMGIPVSTNLSIDLGLQAVIPLTTTYSISERLISPQDVVFETGNNSRNLKTGNVSAAGVYALAPFSLIGPNIKLSRSWAIQPQVTASYALSSLTVLNAWSFTSAGIGFRLTRIDSATVIDTTRIVLPDEKPIVQEPEKTPQQIAIAGGVLYDDSSSVLNQLDITYSVKRRRLAVLPAVYFDSASYEIPSRYKRYDNYSGGIKTIENARDIDVNHAILMILAGTLKSNQGAKVVITGCHAEDGEPGERAKLARGRAEAVFAYLTSTYGVDPQQLSVKTRALPERFSSTRTATGRAENRRVEFKLQNAPYELPVQADTLIVQQFGKAVFDVSATRPETIRGWRARLVSGPIDLYSSNGTGALPRDQRLDLTLQQQQSIRRNGGADLLIEIDDAEDGTISKRYRLVTATSRADDLRPFDEFGIVLFDYNSSKVSDDELGTIDELRERARRADYIQITGTADASGNQEYNLKLAEQRALSVVREMKLRADSYELRSQISEDYPVDLPEGRMLGRQVKVVMRTGK